MRKQLLGVVLPLLILVQVSAAADTQSTGTSATTHAVLQQVNVVRGEDWVSVEITARGPATPRLSTLSSPARVVNRPAEYGDGTEQRHLTVDSDA